MAPFALPSPQLLFSAAGCGFTQGVWHQSQNNVSETCLFKQLAMCIDTWMLMNDMISQEKMASCARGQSVLLQPVECEI